MYIKPGPHNLLTDIEGLCVGQVEDHPHQTGVTVILPQQPVTAAVDVRGGGPGTRETDVLAPTCIADKIHGLVFSGGSAFGLAAADGAMRFLAEQQRGFSYHNHIIPIVPAAICFDLQPNTTERASYADLGYHAAIKAQPGIFNLGNAGAGYGTKAGPLKGGMGSASFIREDGLAVAALVVVNSYGSVTMGNTPLFHAWPYEWDDEFGGLKPYDIGRERLSIYKDATKSQIGQNTTLAVVATNYPLDKSETKMMAQMAHDGMGRAIDPIHSYYDGDVVFALTTGLWHNNKESDRFDRLKTITWIGQYGAYCLSRAIGRAVYEAKTTKHYQSYREHFGL